MSWVWIITWLDAGFHPSCDNTIHPSGTSPPVSSMMKLGDNRPRLFYPTTERLTMVKEATDRNLLFGLLALQNGLIDQGQLVAAFHAWTRDKERPIADHLVGHSDLDAEQRALLEG